MISLSVCPARKAPWNRTCATVALAQRKQDRAGSLKKPWAPTNHQTSRPPEQVGSGTRHREHGRYPGGRVPHPAGDDSRAGLLSLCDTAMRSNPWKPVKPANAMRKIARSNNGVGVTTSDYLRRSPAVGARRRRRQPIYGRRILCIVRAPVEAPLIRGPARWSTARAPVRTRAHSTLC